MNALTEDVKKVIKETYDAVDWDKIQFFDLMKVFIDFLNVYSDLAIKIGTIEKESPQSYIAIQNIGKMGPTFMIKLSEDSPPKDFGIFIKAMLKLMEIGPKMDNMNLLSAEEKLELGSQLKDITNILNKIVKKAKRKVKQEGTQKNV